MKFSLTIASLLLLVPLLAEAAQIEARDPHHHHHLGRGRGGAGAGGGKFKGNGGGGGGGKKASTGTTTTAAAGGAAGGAGAAATSTTAAAVVTGPGQPIGNPGDAKAAQSSTTLSPQVIMKALASNGQAVQEVGQVASLTTTNNFINFCLDSPNTPLTNGQQVSSGSCNQTPMGLIFASDKIPSAKFSNPVNNQVVPENTPFNISMNILNMETGFFTSATNSYYAAPQQLNAQGILIGHSHFVVEPVKSLTSTDPTAPLDFAFFKGVNTAAVNGVLSAPVPSGLPAGTYRLGSINTASNHQPALCPVAQHGLVDDVVYFTVSGSGAGAGNGAGAGKGGAGKGGAGGAAASSVAASGTASSSAAASSNTDAGSASSKSGKNANGGQQQGSNKGQQQKGGQQKGGQKGGRKGGRGRFYRRSAPSRLE